MFDALSKTFFHTLAASSTLERLASRYGMAKRESFARRFVAGDTVREAIEAARELQARGMLLTLDQLGESVSSLDEADAASRVYLQTIAAIVASGIERNISLKLSQLGLNLDRAVCTDNLRRILMPAARERFFVRVDMEDSPTVQTTLDIVATLWDQDFHNIGVVLQSALYRSEDDLRRMNEKGVRVRLVKGAYKEPRAVAYQKKADVDAAYARLMERLLAEGTYPALATHDPELIERAKRFAAARGIGADRFEFQMLYGVRRDLQSALVAEGYRVRVYVPFGTHWFPYYMRRLGERPANVAFVLKSLLKER
ncbi:MAG TPA: proline dehydrogenase family protein [Vicinamibacterales bacterium]|nr:proline dehydrogenase family protein [Vicinamibacterales bacterium]